MIQIQYDTHRFSGCPILSNGIQWISMVFQFSSILTPADSDIDLGNFKFPASSIAAAKTSGKCCSRLGFKNAPCSKHHTWIPEHGRIITCAAYIALYDVIHLSLFITYIYICICVYMCFYSETCFKMLKSKVKWIWTKSPTFQDELPASSGGFSGSWASSLVSEFSRHAAWIMICIYIYVYMYMYI